MTNDAQAVTEAMRLLDHELSYPGSRCEKAWKTVRAYIAEVSGDAVDWHRSINEQDGVRCQGCGRFTAHGSHYDDCPVPLHRAVHEAAK